MRIVLPLVIAAILLLFIYAQVRSAPQDSPQAASEQKCPANLSNEINESRNTLVSLEHALPADSIAFFNASLNTAAKSCREGNLTGARVALWRLNAAMPYDEADAQAYLWIRNNIRNRTILSWWDYGESIEKIGLGKSVVKYPSPTLVKSEAIAAVLLKRISPEEIPTEEESKIDDVSRFLMTANETEAVCIAKRYGAEYALVYAGDMGKSYGMGFQQDGTRAGSYAYMYPLLERNGSGWNYGGGAFYLTLEFNLSTTPDSGAITLLNASLLAKVYYWTGENGDKKIETEAIGSASPEYKIFVSDDLSYIILTNTESMLVKSLFAESFLKNFEKVYGNNETKIFSINTSACPE